MSENKEAKENIYQKVIGWVIVIWILGFYPIVFFPKYGIAPEMAGIFGDQFGAVNALFSGLAFAFFFYSLKLQRESIEQQTKQIKLQEHAIEKQTKSLDAQIEELKFQRKEYELSRKEQEKMNESFKIQNNIGILDSRLKYINDLLSVLHLFKEEIESGLYPKDIDGKLYDELKQKLKTDRKKYEYLFPDNLNPLFERAYKTQYILKENFNHVGRAGTVDQTKKGQFIEALEKLEISLKKFIQDSITPKNKTNSGDA